MPSRLRRFIRPDRPELAPLAARLAVGFVFVVSGALKFLFANQGAGRFARLGLPAPHLLSSLVGGVELAAGLLVLAGLAVRLAAVPLVLDMLCALAITKLPLLTGPGPEPVSAIPRTGLLAFAYQARLDLAMLALCVGLVATGAGAVSLDAWWARRTRARTTTRDGAPTTALGGAT